MTLITNHFYHQSLVEQDLLSWCGWSIGCYRFVEPCL